MAEIERGPEPRDVFDYTLRWASVRQTDPVYRTLFPHGIGGKKIPVDRNSRPERVRIDQEELQNQLRVTQRAENKYKYLQIKPEVLLDPNWLRRVILKEQQLKENIAQNINFKDTKNMNNSNKMFQKLFNKFLIEQKTTTKVPIVKDFLPQGYDDPSYNPDAPHIDPEFTDAPLTVVYDPDTGGPGFTPSSWNSTLSDIGGNIIPALAAEIALGVLTRGRSVVAKRARDMAMRKAVVKLQGRKSKVYANKIQELTNNIPKPNPFQNYNRPGGFNQAQTAYQNAINAVPMQARTHADRWFNTRVDAAAKSISKIDFENRGWQQTALKNAERAVGWAPYVLTAAVALDQSAKARKELPPGTENNDSRYDEILYPLMAVGVAKQISQLARASLPLSGRHWARRDIAKEQKRLQSLSPSDPDYHAVRALYGKPQPQTALPPKFGGKNKDVASSRAYSENPHYGSKAWQGQSSSNTLNNAVGQGFKGWVKGIVQKAIPASYNNIIAPLVGINPKGLNSFDSGRGQIFKELLPLGLVLSGREIALAGNKASFNIGNDRAYQTGGANRQHFINPADAYLNKNDWKNTAWVPPGAPKLPLNVVAVVKPPVPMYTEIGNMFRGGLKYAPLPWSKRNQSIDLYRTRQNPGGGQNWQDQKESWGPEIVRRIDWGNLHVKPPQQR